MVDFGFDILRDDGVKLEGVSLLLIYNDEII